jgi:hypothetical protein
MNDSNNDANVLRNIKTPKVFYVVLAIILFLIVCLVLMYFKVNIFLKKGKSDKEVMNHVLSTFFFSIIIIILCAYLLPNIKDLKSLFSQISNVTYAILYTIGLILFFGFMSPTIINDNAYIILPFLVIIGVLVFYKSSTYSYVSEFNINYERIKSVILFLCVIAVFIIFYKNDPGGYISEYFGFSFLISILLGVFGLLYLIIVITLPDTPEKGAPSNLFNNFSPFTNYLVTGFVIFLFFFTIMSYFADKKGELFSTFFVIGLIISILWSILIVTNSFPELVDKSVSTSNLNIYKRSLLMLIGVVLSGLFIAWIVTTIQDYSGESSMAYLILNIAIVIIILGLVYKIINITPGGNEKKNTFLNLMMSIIFYIPCYFNHIYDSFGKMLIGDYSSDSGSLLMLISAILLFIIYFNMPSVSNYISTQGGKQLVNKPVNTNSEYALGTYQELNESEEYDYQYGLSFWVFIHAAPPNTNSNYNNYTSLLNFGGKPNVLYNGSTNSLMVTIEQDTENNKHHKLTEYDEKGNRILYKNNNFLLQKWNNIIINYSGGILDIFINGELVKSNIGVVSYYKLDNLTIGENNGIEGGICNVVYFKNALTSTNVYYLYNMAKNKSPPVLNKSNKTIMIKDLENENY